MDYDKVLIIFGANVRSIRLERNISQEKLGELTGLHRTYIGSIERGERNISIKNIVRIAVALDVDTNILFEGILQ